MRRSLSTPFLENEEKGHRRTSFHIPHKKYVLSFEDCKRLFKKPHIQELNLTTLRNSPLFKFPAFLQIYQVLQERNKNIKANNEDVVNLIDAETFKHVCQELQRIQFLSDSKIPFELQRIRKMFPVNKIAKSFTVLAKMPKPKKSERTRIFQLNNNRSHSCMNLIQNKEQIFYVNKKIRQKNNTISSICQNYRTEAANLKNFIQQRQIKKAIESYSKEKARIVAQRLKMSKTQQVFVLKLDINRNRKHNQNRSEHIDIGKQKSMNKQNNQEDINNIGGISLINANLNNHHQNKIKNMQIKTKKRNFSRQIIKKLKIVQTK